MLFLMHPKNTERNNQLRAEKRALTYAERQIKDWLLWSNRPAFEELKTRIKNAFIMGYLSFVEDFKNDMEIIEDES